MTLEGLEGTKALEGAFFTSLGAALRSLEVVLVSLGTVLVTLEMILLPLDGRAASLDEDFDSCGSLESGMTTDR